MAKLYAYIAMMMGIEILLTFYGVQTNMGALLAYFNIIDAPQNISLSNLFTSVVTIITTAGVGAIIAGFFIGTTRESFIIGAIAGFFANYISDLVNIIIYMDANYPGSPITYIITFIFGVLIVGYILTIIDWWRGAD